MFTPWSHFHPAMAVKTWGVLESSKLSKVCGGKLIWSKFKGNLEIFSKEPESINSRDWNWLFEIYKVEFDIWSLDWRPKGLSFVSCALASLPGHQLLIWMWQTPLPTSLMQSKCCQILIFVKLLTHIHSFMLHSEIKLEKIIFLLNSINNFYIPGQ